MRKISLCEANKFDLRSIENEVFDYTIVSHACYYVRNRCEKIFSEIIHE